MRDRPLETDSHHDCMGSSPEGVLLLLLLLGLLLLMLWWWWWWWLLVMLTEEEEFDELGLGDELLLRLNSMLLLLRSPNVTDPPLSSSLSPRSTLSLNSNRHCSAR